MKQAYRSTAIFLSAVLVCCAAAAVYFAISSYAVNLRAKRLESNLSKNAADMLYEYIAGIEDRLDDGDASPATYAALLAYAEKGTAALAFIGGSHDSMYVYFNAVSSYAMSALRDDEGASIENEAFEGALISATKAYRAAALPADDICEKETDILRDSLEREKKQFSSLENVMPVGAAEAEKAAKSLFGGRLPLKKALTDTFPPTYAFYCGNAFVQVAEDGRPLLAALVTENESGGNIIDEDECERRAAAIAERIGYKVGEGAAEVLDSHIKVMFYNNGFKKLSITLSSHTGMLRSLDAVEYLE